MIENTNPKELVDQFLLGQIETVPHLEALLLTWTARPRKWSLNEMAKALYLSPAAVGEILDDLVRRGLVVVSANARTWEYASNPERDRLIAAVDVTYRSELIRVSRLIHGKPSAAIREFARAFRIKKDRD